MNMLKHYLNAVKNTCTEIADRDSFLYALKRIKAGKRDGEYHLARIYEDGNTIVHKDLACAYALYYVAAEKGLKEAQEHLTQLKLLLMADEWQRAKATIHNLQAK